MVELNKGKFEVKSPDLKYLDADVDDWVDFEEDSYEYVGHLKVLKLKVADIVLSVRTSSDGASYTCKIFHPVTCHQSYPP